MRIQLRSLSLLAAALLGASALPACSSSVVGGSGSGSSGPHSGGSSSGGSSSTTPNSSAAPSSGSSTPSAPVSSAANGDTIVRNDEGHYQVQLPGTAKRTTEPGSENGVSFTVHLDSITTPYVALVADEDFAVDLPQSQWEAALKSAVTSFESSAGVTQVSVNDTSFRGQRARTADVTEGGQTYTFLVVIWSNHRLYFMFAPQGQPYDDLTGSFQALP